MGNALSSSNDSSPPQPSRPNDSASQGYDNDPQPISASARRVPSRNSAVLSRLSSYGSTTRYYAAQSDMRTQHAGPERSSEEMMDEREERPLVATQSTTRSVESVTGFGQRSLRRHRPTLSRLGSRWTSSSAGHVDSSQRANRLLSGPDSDRNAGSSASQLTESQPAAEQVGRISLTASLRRRLTTGRGPVHDEAHRHTIRGPFPLGHAHQQLPDTEPRETQYPDSNETTLDNTTARPSHQRRQSRLDRVRNSISAPFSALFPQSDDRPSTSHPNRTLPHRPLRMPFADDSDHLLPPFTNLDHRLDIDNASHELDAVDSESRSMLSTSRATSGMSSIRRFPHGLRSRSTRLIRRGEHPPLSQVLQLAAAAIAAQLSGHSQTNPGSGRTLGSDAFDGSIQNFVQTLQDAASAQAGDNVDMLAADGELPPVNFMRVFQFPNDENGSPITSEAQSRDVDQVDLDRLTGSGDNDRSITLVLVGVRSMPSIRGGGNGESSNASPSLDTLLTLPFLPPANLLRNGSSGALFRRSEGRSRVNTRRHSMTNFSFPAQYETQRHQRTRTSGGRNSVDQTFSSVLGTRNTPTPISESPPGPHPPPSTPADIRSGHATPIRRPSSASGVHTSALPDLEEDGNHMIDADRLDPGFNVARQRRRSDSEFARRPELGSGAARRNGVVEPDHPPTGTGRSWLIYVVGTNVSPDHPAFTMPSLFTDNPSYEDMQMLSNLLGPVKPPVASREEISSAGGTFRLYLNEAGLFARATGEDGESINLNLGERCLVCLGDYVADEEVRQLSRCQHIFHRECIDEWLTTGRNNCPMCRAQGVTEKGGDNSASPESILPDQAA